jgi:hypothetical protein
VITRRLISSSPAGSLGPNQGFAEGQNLADRSAKARIYWENAWETQKKPGKTGFFRILALA